MSDEHGIVFWGAPGSERLTHYTPSDAIIDILEECGPVLPYEIEIVGYRRMKFSVLCMNPLEQLLEQLDEELAGEDGPNDPTPGMVKAETAFLDVVQREYVPWACEQVPGTKETINVVEWVRENTTWILEPYTEGG